MVAPLTQHALASIETLQQDITTLTPPSEKVNILVVDDLREKQLVYRTILEDLGQNVMFANSGEEALKLVLSNEFAVILLDVNMPGMDGFETAEMIRKRRKSAHTPIIFVTAFYDDVRLEKGYASGAVDYLMTPVMPGILRAKVRVFIELSQMRQRAAQQAEEQARLKAAEEAARRKDAFLGMLAHELRNPLYPIRNAIQLLQDFPGSPELLKVRAVIDRQVTHMTRLVDDLLDSTRMAHGKILQQKKPCKFSQIVWDTAKDYEMIFNEKKILVDIDFPDEDIWVHGDPTRLIQMVGNILHNANKFTNPGGKVFIKIFTDEEQKRVLLRVKDTGIGIQPEILPYIFDVFYQAEQKLDRARGGLGLGLFLVKVLTDLHNGTVTVESAGPHQGAALTIQLPMIEPPFESAEILSFTRQKAGQRILLIEDNPDAAMTTRLLLEREGHDARVASTGPEGISLAEEFLPQIIFCDIGLPGMDGYQVARELRQKPALKTSLIVALTGYGRDEDKKMAQEAGFDLHLTKPIDLVNLRQTLAQAGKPPAPLPLSLPSTPFPDAEQKNDNRPVPLALSAACFVWMAGFSFISIYLPAYINIGISLITAGACFVAADTLLKKESRLKKTGNALSDERFLAELNHAIRTPLTTIGGVAEIFHDMEDQLDHKQKQLVRALHTSTMTLKKLVNDALNDKLTKKGQ